MATGNYAIGTFKAGSLVVNQNATTTALSSSLSSSEYGQPVTLTATVTTNAPGSGTPTGTVTFMDGTATLGSAALTGGMATLPVSTLPVGVNVLTASYSGDANFAASATGATISTVAGGGDPGDGGQATAAELYEPTACWRIRPADIFIADTLNNRIREVNHATGVITTVAGNGTAGLQRRRRPGHRCRA